MVKVPAVLSKFSLTQKQVRTTLQPCCIYRDDNPVRLTADATDERSAEALNSGNSQVKKRGSGYPLPPFLHVSSQVTVETRSLKPAERALNGHPRDVTSQPVLLIWVRTFRTRSDLSARNPAGRS